MLIWTFIWLKAIVYIYSDTAMNPFSNQSATYLALSKLYTVYKVIIYLVYNSNEIPLNQYQKHRRFNVIFDVSLV